MISVWVRSAFPIYALGPASIDDYLFVSQADTILQGQWLGNYSNLTHIKGVAYPVFLAANHWTGLPLKLTEHLVYLASALFLSTTLGRVHTTKWPTLATFTLLAFVPTAWSPETGERVVREGLYVSLVMLLVAVSINCFVFSRAGSIKEELRGKAFSLVALGLVGGVFWLTREEGLWLLPTIMLLAVYWLAKRRHRLQPISATLTFLAIPALVALVPVVCVNALNQFHYGLFRTNDFHSANFTAAYGAISRIKHEQWQPYVVFPKDARQRAYRFSPLARELAPSFEGALGNAWRELGCVQTQTSPCPEILSGWFMWALRDAVQAAGHYRSANEADAFYGKLAAEINAACKNSPGECHPHRATMLPVWQGQYLFDVLGASARVVHTLLRMAPMPVAVGHSIGSPEQLARFARVTNGPLSTPIDCASQHCAEGNEGVISEHSQRLEVAEFLAKVERAVMGLGLPTTMIALLVFGLLGRLGPENADQQIIYLSLILALSSRIVLLGVLDATSIPANNMLYLSPIVPLALALVPTIAWGLWETVQARARSKACYEIGA